MVSSTHTKPVDNLLGQGSVYLSLVLFGLMAVLPFLYPFHSEPQTGFYAEWIAFVLGAGACAVFLARAFWLKFNVPKTVLYVLALVLVIAIQGLWIPRPYIAQGLLPGLYLCWAALLITLAAWLRTVMGLGKAVVVLGWFVLVGSLLHALTGLVQYLGIAGWFASFVAMKQSAAIHGNVVHSNHFATHLVLGVVALIYLYSLRRLSAVLSFCLLGFFALMAALSGSRAVLLYALALALLSLAACKKRPDMPRLRLVAAPLFFLVTFVCAQYLVIWVNPWLMDELSAVSQNIDPFTHNVALERMPQIVSGIEARTSEWLKAWRMFLEAPLFGIGMGNYAWYSFQYQALPEFSHVPKPLLFSHSHNLFTQVLAETGIAGFSILLGLIIGWIKQFKESGFSLHGWFIAAALLVLFVHSNLEFPLWYSYFLGIAAVLLGLGDHSTVRLTFTPWLGRLGAGLALLLAGFILFFTLMGFRSLANASNTFIETDAQETVYALLRIANNPLLEPYAEAMLTIVMPLSKDGIEEKLRITTRAFKRNPTAFITYKQVTLLSLNGQGQEANQLLEHSARAYPDTLERYIKMLKTIPDREAQSLREYAEQLHADQGATGT